MPNILNKGCIENKNYSWYSKVHNKNLRLVGFNHFSQHITVEQFFVVVTSKPYAAKQFPADKLHLLFTSSSVIVDDTCPRRGYKSTKGVCSSL